MVALTPSMIWRQIAAASELAKMWRTEGLLWAEPRKVSQQALSERVRTFSSHLVSAGSSGNPAAGGGTLAKPPTPFAARSGLGI
jgi:hypothetical protein